MNSPFLAPAYKIVPPQWMRDDAVARLLDTLNTDGPNARLVGGCIRNHFLMQEIKDIDIASALPPKAVMERCAAAGIKVFATGLAHGTVTAHLDGRDFEITTLRHDVETNGRHAQVAFTDDWAADAARRDFTINALYADRDGSIYDPLGTGLDDLRNHIVRFIGDPVARIAEDHLRILRFFRFCAAYHKGQAHAESLAACRAAKEKIHSLSDERIADELLKILALPQADRAIDLMEQAGLFGLNQKSATFLARQIALQQQLQKIDVPARYHAVKFDRKYIKNKGIISFFNKIDEFVGGWNNDMRLALYRFDRTVVVQGLILLKSQAGQITDQHLADAMAMPAPVFPIVAADVMGALNLSEGRAVGVAMKEAEKIWIASGFTLPRNEILRKL